MTGQHRRFEVTFPSGAETLVGDLVVPVGPGPHPLVLSVAGTGPQNRYGDQVLPDGTVQPHSRHHWVGEQLAQAGIAQLCWDKRGVQASTGGPREPGDPPGERDSYTSVETDVQDVHAAIEFLASRSEVDPDRIVVMGTSAGAHFSCRVAERTEIPAAYILWGGVHQDIGDFISYIYSLVLDFSERGPDELALVQRTKGPFLGVARVWPQMLAAARRGEPEYRWTDEDGTERVDYLERTIQELRHAYPEQFAHVRAPVMVIHGDRDINVPVQQAYDSAAALRAAGNPDVTLAIIRGADHGMHTIPESVDADAHLRNWMAGELDGPYSQQFITTVVGWIRDLWVRYPDGAGSLD
ncbi:alpha/beta hydrolase family protein [Euzebya tangerina]|uniref:alpha/beta hydrolase family protein n=1 Tax=Euzebya tangerina TaxID=591198 RepID=UPI000E31743C|nr:prolyl oligopeptidase family serine peptidase [Euzebya tangerina]